MSSISSQQPASSQSSTPYRTFTTTQQSYYDGGKHQQSFRPGSTDPRTCRTR
jgi:hypothetical protein